MYLFLASSPAAASKIGRYADIARQRVEGGPLAGMGMQAGGSTTPEGYKGVSRIQPVDDTGTTDPDDLFPDYGVAPPDSDVQPPEDQPDPPEGSQVLKPGTPTPETTQASTDLDAAQTAYSDAMGTLTEAQKALSGTEAPEGNSTVDAETGRLKFPTFDALKEELGEDFGSNIESVDNTNFLAGNDFKNIIADLDNIPTGDGFEVTGSRNDWTVTFNNGQTIKVNKNNASAAETVGRAAQIAFRNIRGSNIVSDTDAYNVLLENVEDAELLTTQTQADVSTKQKQFETTELPSTSEALGKAITNPSSILQKPTVYGLKVEDGQLIDSGQEPMTIDDVKAGNHEVASPYVASSVAS